jgi:hypothetical protein
LRDALVGLYPDLLTFAASYMGLRTSSLTNVSWSLVVATAFCFWMLKTTLPTRACPLTTK